METTKATVNVYDYGKPNSFSRKVRIFFTKLVEDIILLGVLAVIIYCAYKFLDKDSIGELDNMSNYSVKNLHTYFEENVHEDRYVLTYPDVNNIVSINGKIKNDDGLDLNNFDEGYILMYEDGTYAFKLKYNGYCLSKGIDDKSYKVTILLPCKTKE